MKLTYSTKLIKKAIKAAGLNDKKKKLTENSKDGRRQKRKTR